MEGTSKQTMKPQTKQTYTMVNTSPMYGGAINDPSKYKSTS